MILFYCLIKMYFLLRYYVAYVVAVVGNRGKYQKRVLNCIILWLYIMYLYFYWVEWLHGTRRYHHYFLLDNIRSLTNFLLFVSPQYRRFTHCIILWLYVDIFTGYSSFHHRTRSITIISFSISITRSFTNFCYLYHHNIDVLHTLINSVTYKKLTKYY